MIIGSHGVTHDVLVDADIQKQRNELVESKKVLETLIKKDVKNFAYSHGVFNKETIKLMSEYEYGFVVKDYPINFITAFNKKTLPRYNVNNDTFLNVLLKLDRVFKGK